MQYFFVEILTNNGWKKIYASNKLKNAKRTMESYPNKNNLKISTNKYKISKFNIKGE